MYEEKEELVSIIKQAAKERLSMERQLAIAKPTLVSYMHYVLPNSFSPFMYLEFSPFLPKIISLP